MERTWTLRNKAEKDAPANPGNLPEYLFLRFGDEQGTLPTDATGHLDAKIQEICSGKSVECAEYSFPRS